ncbi:RHS repeat-associated core domain-containing protein [Caldithrix abyssi DSM 13497]|uniref:RHS repeat-associated core domain-containing protein n=1 Tax=Caldithrix abyssi DSM 13497 TaxID=880073 RepID=H1XVW7_CALAY|nr:RHS repeat-associated core domain-containing protein [Caldithrix abyssi]APF20827.1 RHS repeat-associated core domain-containing protein [Caldithrix abyssi DSM 13497]EHO40694.1 RHS repeat-associated core domain-containing protein [Caldithrix abyssi DSM 13497]
MPGIYYNVGNSNDRYKYNSKELETVGSLSKYHYGFREYDPEIGRWNRVDPLYYQTPGQSPYNFVSNNPVNSYDVMGLVTNTELKAFFTLKFAGWGAEFSQAPDYSEVESYGGVIGGGSISDDQLRAMINEAWIKGDILNNYSEMVSFLYDGQYVVIYGYYPDEQAISYQSDDADVIATKWEILDYSIKNYNGNYHNNKNIIGALISGVGTVGTYLGYKGNAFHNELYWKAKNGKIYLRSYLKKPGGYARSYKIVGEALEPYKKLSRRLTLGGLALTVGDVILKRELKASNILDIGLGVVSVTTGVGSLVAGAYIVTDIGFKVLTGVSLSERLDHFVNKKFSWN